MDGEALRAGQLHQDSVAIGDRDVERLGENVVEEVQRLRMHA